MLTGRLMRVPRLMPAIKPLRQVWILPLLFTLAVGSAASVAPISRAEAAVCPTGKFFAEYFAGTVSLTGTPVKTACEGAIKYDYGAGGPTGVGVDFFSARWTGRFSFAAGSYTFTARADDGVRMYLDGAPIIDSWVDQAATTYTATRTVTAGDHELKIEYYERWANASIQVAWAASGGTVSSSGGATRGPKPDVYPVSLSVGTGSATAGSSIPLQLVIKNSGKGTADEVSVDISLASGGIGSLVSRIPIGTLKSGQSTTIVTTLTTPRQSGSYDVLAAVTAARDTNAANDIIKSSLQVTDVMTASSTNTATTTTTGSGTTTPSTTTSPSTTTTASDTTTSSTNTSTTTSTTQAPAATQCPPAGVDLSLVRYAAPGGGGNGLTSGSPYRVSDFLNTANPGSTLCLASGTYTASNGGLLRPPLGRSGTSTAPITVAAIDERNPPLFDGQFAAEPILLKGNSFWVLQGFNAKNGAYAVIQNRDGSNNNIFRRIVAWDMDIRLNGWTVWNVGDTNVLFEDVAAFGPGMGSFGNGGTMTCRRCWGRHEGSTSNFSHKENFGLGYNNAATQCENCFSTATAISMPISFTVTDSNGNAAGTNPNCGPGGTQSTMPCPLALFRIRSGDGALPTGNALLGSMAYIPSASTWTGTIGFRLPQFGWDVSDTVVKHTANFVSPSFSLFSSWQGFDLGNSSTSRSANNSADRLTSLRSTDNVNFAAASPWAIGNLVSGTTFSSVAAASPWTGTVGAQFCYRWVHGAVTTTPLWPWPMNERIKAATASAGSYSGPCLNCVGGRQARTPTDLTAEIEGLLSGQFGPIPSQCRSN